MLAMPKGPTPTKPVVEVEVEGGVRVRVRVGVGATASRVRGPLWPQAEAAREVVQKGGSGPWVIWT